MKHAFITDCEGPLSKNDNAYELTAHYVPHGNRLFSIISRYDDVLAEVIRRPGYKAGDTLKLILPFLKAYGVTDRKMEEFSAGTLSLIRDTKETLRHVRTVAGSFIVSTSYEHYIRAMCRALDFPCESVYCTKTVLDNYNLQPREETRLQQIAEEIAEMAFFEIPPQAKTLGDLPKHVQKLIKQLDTIFWKEIAQMGIGRIFSEVDPMGGREKAEAVKDITLKLGLSISETMYVGDSITDEEALRLVSENDGLAVSFNGNRHAVENAEIAVLSETSLVTAIIAEVFCRFGKQHALAFAEDWTLEALKKVPADKNLLNRFLKLYSHALPKVKLVAKENMNALAEESTRLRKRIRGEAVGRLG